LIGKDLDIAAQNIAISEIGVSIAQQQLGIAQINARFAADIVRFLNSRLLDSRRFAWMAGVARDNYRILLGYAVTAAWLAERALEFERQTEVNIIRFDYWRDTEHGLMGVDQLRVDIETLEKEKLVNETRKQQITRAISLAQLSPLELARFRATGTIYLTTLEEWFERDFPRQYLRLIKGVSVNVAALVPPTDSVKATLTLLGTTRTLLATSNDVYGPIEIRRPPETISISSPLNATGVFTPLLPESPYLNPFEGSGVEGNWLFEMSKASNPSLNYDAIADVQIVFQYTSLEDVNKRPIFPLAAKGSVSYSLVFNAPDSNYHLHNPVFNGGPSAPHPYVAVFTLVPHRLPPNQSNRRFRAINLLFERAGASTKRPITTLRFVPDGGAPLTIWQDEVCGTNGFFRRNRSEVTPASVRDALGDVAGRWELEFLHDEAAWNGAVTALGLTAGAATDTDLFARDAAGQVVTRAGYGVLDLSWLKDVLVEIEFDHLLV
jgi:hypothetical protein